jgi:deoxyxylulose-5-phosphate synthase
MVNLLRKRGGQFAPENSQKVPLSEVVSLLRNQVVNLLRKEGGHFQPELGGQYHRILQLGSCSI